LFNPNVPSKMSPFARKYLKYREGNLVDFEEEEKEKFDAYVQRMAAEELEEGEESWGEPGPLLVVLRDWLGGLGGWPPPPPGGILPTSTLP